MFRNIKFLFNFVLLYSKNKDLIKKLKDRLTEPLPYLDAHLKVAVRSRLKAMKGKPYSVPKGARQSAVLIHLYDSDEELKFPLILRNTYEGVHSNQIGLPGGKLESAEIHKEAALREFHEELNYKVEGENLIGELSSVYIPPSNFLMKPFISYSSISPNFIPDPIEVSEIFYPTVSELIEADIKERRISVMENEIAVNCFILQEQIVWGATAAVLSEFKDVLMEISR